MLRMGFCESPIDFSYIRCATALSVEVSTLPIKINITMLPHERWLKVKHSCVPLLTEVPWPFTQEETNHRQPFRSATLPFNQQNEKC